MGEAREIYNQAKQIIREDYAYLTGIDELAERVGVSKPHLIRLFKAHNDESPNKYLTSVRVEAARQLLLTRGYKLDIIAGMTGFAEANYFCKVFKKETGVTPGVYRKQNAGKTPVSAEISADPKKHEAY